MKRLLLLAAILGSFTAAAPVGASGGGHGDGEKKPAKAKAPQKNRTFTSLKSWVSVDPFTISIVQDGRVRGKFTVWFGMDVPDEKLRDKAETIMPRLRDAWLGELNLYAATTLRPRRAADVAAVSDLLQQTANKVLAQPGSKVLLGQVTVDMAR